MKKFTFVFILIVLMYGIWGCSRRSRSNPLDPLNSETYGRPTGLIAGSDKHQVTLQWDRLILDRLEGFNIYRRQEDQWTYEHIDFVSSEFNAFCADYPGVLRRSVRDALGVDLPVLFLTGCAGNVQPIGLKKF